MCSLPDRVGDFGYAVCSEFERAAGRLSKSCGGHAGLAGAVRRDDGLQQIEQKTAGIDFEILPTMRELDVVLDHPS